MWAQYTFILRFQYFLRYRILKYYKKITVDAMTKNEQTNNKMIKAEEIFSLKN